MHKERYGAWAGNNAGHKAVLSRCCESVYSHGSRISSQCSRKSGHGADGLYCKQHDPAAVARRNAIASYKYDLATYQRRMRRLSEVLPVIRAIAEGHNDPRSLCQEWLDKRAAMLTPPVAPKESSE